MATGHLTARQFQQAGGTEDWRTLAFGAGAWFDAPSHPAGARLLDRIAGLADGAELDVDLRSTGVHVRLPARGGFPAEHVARARAVSAAARELGLRADPAGTQSLQVAVDVLDRSAVAPFWQTALGYTSGGPDLVDPLRRDPAVWFQRMDRPRPLRNRIHLDVVLPYPAAAERIAALTAAGAQVRREEEYYATVADAEGNEVDLLPRVPSEAPGAPAASDWRLHFGATVSTRRTAPARPPSWPWPWPGSRTTRGSRC
ncbi:VOC family protein [Georgenia alba]|uniref:VOC family protein n=1 Tax=Georgenia alba TaxID=2233858 RepID=A0ABW2QCU5_9MICO